MGLRLGRPQQRDPAAGPPQRPLFSALVSPLSQSMTCLEAATFALSGPSMSEHLPAWGCQAWLGQGGRALGSELATH